MMTYLENSEVLTVFHTQQSCSRRQYSKLCRQFVEIIYKWKLRLLNTVENNVAKGEIAFYEQFLLLPNCFLKSSAAEASDRALM